MHHKLAGETLRARKNMGMKAQGAGGSAIIRPVINEKRFCGLERAYPFRGLESARIGPGMISPGEP